MATRKINPTSPGQRGMTRADFSEITTSTPEKSLLKPNKKTGGRNNTGRITTRHIGGGHKRKYRMIDYKREKFGVVGFVKSIPIEIEEAAAIDGCGPVRTYFSVVFPMLRPTMISVGILEIMWIWNDYLLPQLVLDVNEYKTIPIHLQYLKGSYGNVDLGATMAIILMSIIPVIVFYLVCQKYIIKGVAAGAVKG